jgi:hypothetical protein
MEPPILHLLGQGTGAITYFKLGFCPIKIKISGLVEEDVAEWFLPMLASPDAIETVDSTGVRTLDGTDGIYLVQFDDGLGEHSGAGGAPTVLEPAEWYKANGIKITASCLPIANGNPYIVEAVRLQVPIIRTVHDGGDASHTYWEDSSVDFQEAGVSGGQSWVIINETNDDYAYVKSVAKPSGQTKHCRLNLAENASGLATAAADCDDDDVAFVIPAGWAQYPLSGVGAMT